MEVFVHFAVLKRIEGSFLERRVRGGEVGEESGEALADFEGVGHGGGLEVGYSSVSDACAVRRQYFR